MTSISKIAVLATVYALTAGPVLAEGSHKWFWIDASDGTCDASPISPQRMYDSESDIQGLSVNRITPEDVTKDDKGNIHVTVTGKMNGKGMEWNFFTLMDACEGYIRDNHITAQQAQKGDIN